MTEVEIDAAVIKMTFVVIAGYERRIQYAGSISESTIVRPHMMIRLHIPGKNRTDNRFAGSIVIDAHSYARGSCDPIETRYLGKSALDIVVVIKISTLNAQPLRDIVDIEADIAKEVYLVVTIVEIKAVIRPRVIRLKIGE